MRASSRNGSAVGCGYIAFLLVPFTRLVLSADGLEEPRDILAFFEGFVFAAQYLRENGADEAVVATTVVVLKMLPKEDW